MWWLILSAIFVLTATRVYITHAGLDMCDEECFSIFIIHNQNQD